MRKGKYDAAAAAVERALALSGRHCWGLATHINLCGVGKIENARDAFHELESRSARDYISTFDADRMPQRVEKSTQAIAYAQQALHDRDPLFCLTCALVARIRTITD